MHGFHTHTVNQVYHYYFRGGASLFAWIVEQYSTISLVLRMSVTRRHWWVLKSLALTLPNARAGNPNLECLRMCSMYRIDVICCQIVLAPVSITKMLYKIFHVTLHCHVCQRWDNYKEMFYGFVRNGVRSHWTLTPFFISFSQFWTAVELILILMNDFSLKSGPWLVLYTSWRWRSGQSLNTPCFPD